MVSVEEDNIAPTMTNELMSPLFRPLEESPLLQTPIHHSIFPIAESPVDVVDAYPLDIHSIELAKAVIYIIPKLNTTWGKTTVEKIGIGEFEICHFGLKGFELADIYSIFNIKQDGLHPNVNSFFRAQPVKRMLIKPPLNTKSVDTQDEYDIFSIKYTLI